MSMLDLASGGSSLTDLEANALVAIVGAIIGGLFTLLANYLLTRNEPRKQISWDASWEPGLKEIDPEIRRKLRISYNGTAVENLHSLRYRVQNTGNHVIKNQHIRISFPAGTKIVESRLSPEPEPELRVTQQPSLVDHERSFDIGHLERGQDVQFRFVVSGKDAANWKAVPSNPEGDVDVEQREAARTKDSAAHVVPFLTWAFLLFTVPNLISVGGLFGGILVGVLGVYFLAFALYHLYFVAPIVRELVIGLSSQKRKSDINVNVTGGAAIVVSEEGVIHGDIEIDT